MIILASDYDNTLHFKDGVKEKDLEMIHKLRKNGGKFGLVSGRAISSLLNEAEKYKIPYDFIVGVNGGFVIDEHHQELVTSYIDIQDAKELIDYFENNRPNSYTLHDGYNLSRKIFVSDFELGIDVPFIEMKTLLQNKVSGFFVNYDSEDKALEATLSINKNFPNVLAQQNTRFVDISAPNINKALGLQNLLDYKKWDDPLWVIGDAQNDQEMIESFNSFAMSHGDLILQKSADYVVDSLAEAIQHLLNL